MYKFVYQLQRIRANLVNSKAASGVQQKNVRTAAFTKMRIAAAAPIEAYLWPENGKFPC